MVAIPPPPLMSSTTRSANRSGRIPACDEKKISSRDQDRDESKEKRHTDATPLLTRSVTGIASGSSSNSLRSTLTMAVLAALLASALFCVSGGHASALEPRQAQQQQNTADLEACPGYTAHDVQTSANGLTASLTLAGTPCNAYGRDLTELKLTVEYQTGEIVLRSGRRAKQSLTVLRFTPPRPHRRCRRTSLPSPGIRLHPSQRRGRHCRHQRVGI